ncbi:TPA: DUF551 domain-containing protein [Escherichia coli]|nr:DUF551 domain-containing protein [Escherichia coli]
MWIKCSVRMPEHFSYVIITDGEHVEVKWWNGDKWDCWADCWVGNSNICSDDVTHWMPLPVAPK